MPEWSSYAYTFNNPVNFTDPTGMMPEGGGCEGDDCDPPDVDDGTLGEAVVVADKRGINLRYIVNCCEKESLRRKCMEFSISQNRLNFPFSHKSINNREYMICHSGTNSNNSLSSLFVRLSLSDLS